jgi:hypothetical protein
MEGPSLLFVRTQVVALGFVETVARAVSVSRIPLSVGKLTRSHRMTNFQLNLTLHFSEDFNTNHLLAC